MRKFALSVLVLIFPLVAFAATKAELVTELGSKYYKVGVPQFQQERVGMRWYVVEIYEKSADGESIIEGTVAFYVENEGEANEAAYWSRSEPKPAPAPETFAERLQAAIDAKVSAGDIKYARVLDSNAEVKKALVEVVTNTDMKQTALVEEDAEGNFSVTILQ